jgi:hypothetical protein
MEPIESESHIFQIIRRETRVDQAVGISPAQTPLSRGSFNHAALDSLKMMGQQKQSFVPMYLHKNFQALVEFRQTNRINAL